jgi:hypothetical protein
LAEGIKQTVSLEPCRRAITFKSGEQREKKEGSTPRSTDMGQKTEEPGVKYASHKELEEKRELTVLRQFDPSIIRVQA